MMQTQSTDKREAARLRAAAWRVANPERTKALAARSRAKRDANWDGFLAAERLRYAKNAAAVNARQKAAREADPTRRAAVAHRHFAANPAEYAARCADRKARKLRATPAWADLRSMRALYAEARRLTVETGIRHEVDHIVPLQGKTVCGLHVLCNLRVVTREANRRKGAKLQDGAHGTDYRPRLPGTPAVLQVP